MLNTAVHYVAYDVVMSIFPHITTQEIHLKPPLLQSHNYISQPKAPHTHTHTVIITYPHVIGPNTRPRLTFLQSYPLISSLKANTCAKHSYNHLQSYFHITPPNTHTYTKIPTIIFHGINDCICRLTNRTIGFWIPYIISIVHDMWFHI